MSFDRPITNSTITSMKPITPARSITLNGTGLRAHLLDDRPEDVAAVERQEREQVHDRERQRDDREDPDRVGEVADDRLARDLVGADDARDLLALLRSRAAVRAARPSRFVMNQKRVERLVRAVAETDSGSRGPGRVAEAEPRALRWPAS